MLLPCTITKVLLLAHARQGAKPGKDTGQKAGCELVVTSKFYPPILSHRRQFSAAPRQNQSLCIWFAKIVKQHWSNHVWGGSWAGVAQHPQSLCPQARQRAQTSPPHPPAHLLEQQQASTCCSSSLKLSAKILHIFRDAPTIYRHKHERNKTSFLVMPCKTTIICIS